MKQFLYKISYTILPILFAFYIAGSLYKYYIAPNESGDLGKLGKICFGKKYSLMFKNNYLKNDLVDDFQGEIDKKYDIITFGDSFSQQSIYRYQNYLAHLRKGEKILNIKTLENMGPEQTALVFLNSGILAKFSPKIVIIESVERSFISRLQFLNFDAQSATMDIQKKYQKKTQQTSKPTRNNLYETLNWIRLHIGFKNPVKEMQLKDSLFSLCDNKLYFFQDDLKKTGINDEEKEITYSAINTLKQKFNANNFQFIYIVAADKYDVYEPFIVENSYPRNKTLDYFNHLDTTDFFINTKSFLQPLVRNGIKDVYMANDTHWSYIAHELLAQKIASVIKE